MLPPWGQRSDGTPDAAELATADRILQLHDQGQGIRPIARQIAAEGAKARTGGPMNLRTVCRILERAGAHTRKPQAPARPIPTVTTGSVPPFGWRVDAHGRRVPDEHEQAAIAAVVSLRWVGCSLSAIAEQLAEEGYLSRAGTRITPQRVSRILARVRGSAVDENAAP